MDDLVIDEMLSEEDEEIIASSHDHNTKDSGAYWGENAISAALLVTKYYSDKYNAFRICNSKNFKEQITDLKNPKKFYEIHDASIIVRSEISRQKKIAKKRKKEIHSSSVRFFTHTQSIDHDTFSRKNQALSLAKDLHTRIDKEERKTLFRKTVDHLSLNEENSRALLQSYRTWKKEHPNESIEVYLIAQGVSLKKKQETSPTFEEKSYSTSLKKTLKDTRSEVIEKHTDIIQFVDRAVTKSLDPESTLLSKEELEAYKKKIIGKSTKQEHIEYGEIEITSTKDASLEKKTSLTPINQIATSDIAFLYSDLYPISTKRSEEVNNEIAPENGIEQDVRYKEIEQELKSNWEKKNTHADWLSEEGQNYLFGYIDPKDRYRPTLKKEAEQIFRSRFLESSQEYDKKEKIRIYDNIKEDPAIREIEKDILTHTNNDIEVKQAHDPSNTWNKVHRSIEMRQWERFVTLYPEKAEKYSLRHEEIRNALQRQEQRKQKEYQERTTRLNTNSSLCQDPDFISTIYDSDKGINARIKKDLHENQILSYKEYDQKAREIWKKIEQEYIANKNVPPVSIPQPKIIPQPITIPPISIPPRFMTIPIPQSSTLMPSVSFPFTSTISNWAGNAASSFATKALGSKLLSSAAAGLLTGGVGTALSMINQVTQLFGVDIIGISMKAFIGIVVLIFFVLPLLTISSFPDIETIQLAKEQSTFSWKKFDQSLTYKTIPTTWERFHALLLNPHRHDDMQK